MANESKGLLSGLNPYAKNGRPLEDEYSPVDAVLIGAGNSFDNAWSGAKAGYYKARANLANAARNPAAEQEYRLKMAEALRQRSENERLYEPLSRAYPYLAKFGESLPAVAGGIHALSTAATINLADPWLREVATLAGINPDDMGAARGLLGGMRAVMSGNPKGLLDH